MRYVLNSAVVTTPGVYRYGLLSRVNMLLWLNEGPYESTLAYQETIDALQVLAPTHAFALNRKSITMVPGDQALVFRLRTRNDPMLKGSLGIEYVLNHCEIGLLEKVSD